MKTARRNRLSCRKSRLSKRRRDRGTGTLSQFPGTLGTGTLSQFARVRSCPEGRAPSSKSYANFEGFLLFLSKYPINIFSLQFFLTLLSSFFTTTLQLYRFRGKLTSPALSHLFKYFAEKHLHPTSWKFI
jgi:hypothetical protein